MDTTSMDTRIETGSPPPRFSEAGSVQNSPTPRFTEHFSNSPPYQGFSEYSAENAPIPRYDYPDGPNPPMQHRLSNKERSMSPSELVSPFPETYQKEEDEKEVAPMPESKPGDSHVESGEQPAKQKKRICGIPLLWLIIIAGIIVALAVGLGVGLGVGLNTGSGNSKSSEALNDTYAIGGYLDPDYYSKSGVFNGSGLALASQSFAMNITNGGQGALVMYFQHWTGTIRWMQLSNGGQWVAGDSSTIVATDAKNSTPLSAVSFVSNGVSQWHVFYVNETNYLKQRSNSNVTSYWQDGLINDLELKVMDADMVGMQACFYGSEYGDSDYAHSPLPEQSANASAATDNGMHMWFASDNSTFQQYGWREGDPAWEYQTTFNNKSGHAGVGCYSWGGGSVTYVMMVNQQNTAEIWWRDTNTNLTNTTTHPINIWVNTTISVPDVWPSTSLGYTNCFYAQDGTDHYIYGHNISWAAENTTWVPGSERFQVHGVPAIPGSHLSVTQLLSSSNGDNLLTFFQTAGNDISQWTRDVIAGPWLNNELPVPST